MTDFKMKCKECNQLVANSNNVLARHVRKEHGMEWIDYVIKHEYGGVHPTCKCGCGQKVKWAKGGFRKFVKGHDARGVNNVMYGRRGKDSPNHGKKRTEEHKEKYREAAKKRWADPDDPRREIMKTKEYRETMRQYAIQKLAEGKIGPQAPYKTEWKHNPFTGKKEYMHSSWESIFLDHMIKEGIPVTKKHNYRFRYKDMNGIERDYIPDFVEIDNDVIYEVKGGQDEEAELKAAAAKAWCDKSGHEYVILYKKEIYSLDK